jgi:hypothetical protein
MIARRELQSSMAVPWLVTFRRLSLPSAGESDSLNRAAKRDRRAGGVSPLVVCRETLDQGADAPRSPGQFIAACHVSRDVFWGPP